jgi:hypothetical protein
MSRIRHRKTIATCVVLASVALFTTLVLTHAGRAKPRPSPSPQADGSTEAARGAIKPGDYATAINIHNPSPTATVTYSVKAVQDGVPPSAFTTYTLSPDYAEEFDCLNIRKVVPPGPTALGFIKGFVVIFVAAPPTPNFVGEPLPLDVVGVYTAQPPSVTIPIPYGTSGSGTQTEIPGMAEKLLTITPRLEFVPATTAGIPGPLPPGRYFEYAAKFLCGEVTIPTPG